MGAIYCAPTGQASSKGASAAGGQDLPLRKKFSPPLRGGGKREGAPDLIGGYPTLSFPFEGKASGNGQKDNCSPLEREGNIVGCVWTHRNSAFYTSILPTNKEITCPYEKTELEYF